MSIDATLDMARRLCVDHDHGIVTASEFAAIAPPLIAALVDEIDRLGGVIAALDAEVGRWQSECVDARAALAREVGRSHGMARWGCPSCPPGDDQEVVGDLGLVCLRCGTRYYDGHEETS